MISRRRRIFLAGLAISASCGGGGSESSTPTPPTSPTSALSVSLASATLSVVQGGSASLTVSLTRTNFVGGITIAATGAPSGLTIAPLSIPGSETSGALQMAAGSTAVPGTYPLTVSASGSGVATASAQVVVTITAAVPSSFALSVSPTSLSIVQGAAAQTITIAVARTNFTAPVQLSVTGAPSGMTATLDVPSLSSAEATAKLSIAASGTSTPGTYPITIRATAASAADQSAAVAVTVTPAATSSTLAIDMSPCADPFGISFFAFQDGPNAPWVSVTGAQNVYRVTATNGRIGIATMRSRDTEVFFLSTTELQKGVVGTICSPPGLLTGGGKHLKIQVSAGLSLQDVSVLRLGSVGGTQLVATQGLQTISSVFETDKEPLVAFREALSATNLAGAVVLLRRGIDTGLLPFDAVITPPLDFTAEAVKYDLAPMTISGMQASEVLGVGSFNQLQPTCAFYTAPRAMGIFDPLAGAIAGFSPESTTTAAGLLLSPAFATTSNTVTVASIPSTFLTGNETSGTFAMAATGLFPNTNPKPPASSIRVFAETNRTFSARTLALPSAMPTVTPTIVAGGYRRFRFQYTLPADIDSATTVVTKTNSQGSLTMRATAAYLGGRAVDLTTPSFTGLAGWNDIFGPQGTVVWEVRGASDTRQTPCSVGRSAASSVFGVL